MTEGFRGFNRVMVYMPDKDASIIVLSNMQENKNGISPSDNIAFKIIDIITKTF